MKATVLAFTGKYLDCKKDRVCCCMVRGNELFNFETRFEYGSGGPSFWVAAGMQNLQFVLDKSHRMRRVNFQCTNCGVDLAHVIDNSSYPTMKTYCIDSELLELEGWKVVNLTHVDTLSIKSEGN
jgi:peptide-methionine (R)-S-oxide reductase